MLQFLLGRFRPIETQSALAALLFGLIMLMVRGLLGLPFWMSGQTRWISFPNEIAGSTLYLFENLFVLHFGFFELPIPFPAATAWITSIAELTLPVLLIIGLFSRLWALALLVMSIVIELVFPEAFINFADPMNSHALWMAYGVAVVIFGPGMFSLDWLVRRYGPGGRLTTATDG